MRQSRMWVGTFLVQTAVLTASTMSAVSLQFPAGPPDLRGRKIILSVSVESLTGPRNSAVAVFSLNMSHPSVVVPIFRLTVCLCCTGNVLVPDTTTVVMLGSTGRYEYVGVEVGPGAGRGTRSSCRGYGVSCHAACCLEFSLSAAAAATSSF